MTWAGSRECSSPGLTSQLFGGYRPRSHDSAPLLPFRIADPDRYGIAQGLPVSKSGNQLQLVSLERHTGPSPRPETATSQLLGNLYGSDSDVGWDALHRRDKSRAVGLPGGKETQHKI